METGHNSVDLFLLPLMRIMTNHDMYRRRFIFVNTDACMAAQGVTLGVFEKLKVGNYFHHFRPLFRGLIWSPAKGGGHALKPSLKALQQFFNQIYSTPMKSRLLHLCISAVASGVLECKAISFWCQVGRLCSKFAHEAWMSLSRQCKIITRMRIFSFSIYYHLQLLCASQWRPACFRRLCLTEFTRSKTWPSVGSIHILAQADIFSMCCMTSPPWALYGRAMMP